MPSEKKNRIAFFVPAPIGISPGQRFRFEQYLNLLKEKGYEPIIFSFWDMDTFKGLYNDKLSVKVFGLIKGFFRRWVHLLQALSMSKTIFVYREVLPIGPPIFEFILSKIFKKKIIYDFDDAIWMPLTSKTNALAKYFKYNQKVAYICKVSKVVSCGNKFLAQYANKFNKNVIVNPTTIDTKYHHCRLKNHSKKDEVVIGWTGTHSNFIYFDIVIEALKKLEEENIPFKFVVIADKNPNINLHNFHFIKWSLNSEIDDLLSFDIGIMPLDDGISELSKGKCGFKALQYMALGIPAIVSPIGVNSEIIQHNKNGFIATNKDWYSLLKILIDDVAKRREIGKNANKYVVKKYSVLSNSDTFLSLFDLK